MLEHDPKSVVAGDDAEVTGLRGRVFKGAHNRGPILAVPDRWLSSFRTGLKVAVLSAQGFAASAESICTTGPSRPCPRASRAYLGTSGP